jgi:hypothetical protein
MIEQKTQEVTGVHRVIFAVSVGTLFEWYDFYLYGSLAAFFRSDES